MKLAKSGILLLILGSIIISGNGQTRVQDSSKPLTANQQDFANDDNFKTSWKSNPAIKDPWYQVTFDREKPFNMITIVEGRANIRRYRLEYQENGVWKTLLSGDNPNRIKIHRFNRIWGDKVRMRIDESAIPPAIAEFGVYNERK